MSAWYILSALGIFPMCPGTPQWMLGAPLFDQAEIKFPDGREIRIEAKRSKPGEFLSRVTLDGSPVAETFVLHSALTKGARLKICRLKAPSDQENTVRGACCRAGGRLAQRAYPSKPGEEFKRWSQKRIIPKPLLCGRGFSLSTSTPSLRGSTHVARC